MLHLKPLLWLLLLPSIGGVGGYFRVVVVVVAIHGVYIKYWLVTFKKEKKKNPYLASRGGGGGWG